jgi:hypothetical protein
LALVCFLLAVYRRFCRGSLQSGATEASCALYANLATTLFCKVLR